LDQACQQLGGIEAAFEISVVLGPHNVVQPDVIVVSALPDRGPLLAAQVKLAVAVSDSTLDEDLAKAARYAAGGIPEYWVADANGRVIHRMWSPGPDGYARTELTAFGERVEAATIAGLQIGREGLA
jgi:Uma2 family endonuclease